MWTDYIEINPFSSKKIRKKEIYLYITIDASQKKKNIGTKQKNMTRKNNKTQTKEQRKLNDYINVLKLKCRICRKQ